jgi:hypothetical protein
MELAPVAYAFWPDERCCWASDVPLRKIWLPARRYTRADVYLWEFMYPGVKVELKKEGNASGVAYTLVFRDFIKKHTVKFDDFWNALLSLEQRTKHSLLPGYKHIGRQAC